MSPAPDTCRRCRSVIMPGLIVCLRCGSPVSDAPASGRPANDAPGTGRPRLTDEEFVWSPGGAGTLPTTSPVPATTVPTGNQTTSSETISSETLSSQTTGSETTGAAAGPENPPPTWSDRSWPSSPPRRPIGRRTVAAGVAVALVLATAVVALGILPGRLATPQRSLRGFFDALTDRDLDTAVGYYFSSPDAPNGPPDPTSLSFAPLDGDGYEPPTDLEITSVDEQDMSVYAAQGYFPEGSEIVRAEVTYLLDGQKVEDFVHLIRSPGSNPYRGWLLLQWADTITATADGGETPTINGLAMQSTSLDGQWQMPTFPGRYLVEMADDELYTTEPQTALVSLNSADEVTLERELRLEAQEAVTQEVTDYLDVCAASTDPAPANCPFAVSSYYLYDLDDGQEISWVIDEYPTLSYQESTTPGTLEVDSDAGYVYAYPEGSDDYLTYAYFYVDGTATYDGEQATFTPTDDGY